MTRAGARRDTPASTVPPVASSRSAYATRARGGRPAETGAPTAALHTNLVWSAGMRRLLLFAVLTACGDNTSSSGVFDGLPVDGTFTVGLEKPATVARDKYGIAHINAKNIRDAA